MSYRILIGLFVLLGYTACEAEQEQQGTLEAVSEGEKATAPVVRFLLSIDEAKARIDNSDKLVVFEISKRDKYEEGHLPQAWHLWRPDYENDTDYPYGGMMISADQLQLLLSQYGVSSDTEIILYDTKGSVDAMRLLWILRSYGHTKAMVMDGGKTAWRQAGYVLSQEQPAKVTATEYHFPEATTYNNIAVIEDVLAALTDTNIVLLDTREPEEFLGKPYLQNGEVLYYKKGAFTSGCIPGAIHMNWSDAVDLDGDHCFKSIQALRYNFAKKGITPDKQIIAYCQSGVRSAHTTFVLMELLGFPRVKNYDGSWIEWSYYHQNGNIVPIEQHTSPAEVRQEYNLLMAKLLE